MLQQLNYIWRLFGTGLSFVLFGVGGVLIVIAIKLLVGVRLFPKERAMLFTRRSISASFRLYINFMRFIGLLSYEIHGQERLRTNKKQLVVANHPSLLDVVFLISIMPHANCVVKGALRHNPFTRPPIDACRFISGDSESLVDDGVASLNSGETLMIFPEGTRTVPDEPFRLHRGAANIALQSQTPITPVYISCKPQTLLKTEKWYQIPKTPPHFTISVLDDMEIESYLTNGAAQSKNARVLTRRIAQCFEQQRVERIGNGE